MPWLDYSIRDKHIHVIGKTGYGKSTLLSYQAWKDIEAGYGGVCIIDPKGGIGGLAEIVSRYIPDDRLDDCVWLDLDNPVPLDFISCAPGQEESVVADLKYILTKGMLDSGNAPNLSSNLENLLYAFINANQNPEMPPDKRCTFLDIHRFFRDPIRQKFILRYVTNPEYKTDWNADNFPSKQDQARIITRINPFVKSKTLSRIFGDPNPRLNIKSIVEGKKILLVSIPVGRESSHDYGALLVAKIQQAIFSPERENTPEDDRIPFFLYVDEFQNFRASEKFDKMLTMARSFKLCLTLANLNMDQLDSQVRSALGIISTFIFFQVHHDDRAYASKIIGDYDPSLPVRKRINKYEDDLRKETTDRTLDFLRREQEYLATLPKYVTIDDLKELSEFHAIYKIGNARSVIESIPEPGPKRPTPEQAAKLEYIKFITQRDYGYRPPSAQSSTIRDGDKSPSNSPAVPHTEGNASRNKPDPKAEGRITQLPDE